MRLTIRILGTEVFHVSTDAEPEDDEPDFSRDLSGGTTYASPMGFTAHMEIPHEVDTPDGTGDDISRQRTPAARLGAGSAPHVPVDAGH